MVVSLCLYTCTCVCRFCSCIFLLSLALSFSSSFALSASMCGSVCAWDFVCVCKPSLPPSSSTPRSSPERNQGPDSRAELRPSTSPSFRRRRLFVLLTPVPVLLSLRWKCGRERGKQQFPAFVYLHHCCVSAADSSSGGWGGGAGGGGEKMGICNWGIRKRKRWSRIEENSSKRCAYRARDTRSEGLAPGLAWNGGC